LTEAQAYRNFAKDKGLIRSDAHVRLETFARDSLENLLFTIALLMMELDLRAVQPSQRWRLFSCASKLVNRSAGN
jgi:hypothetical protein